MRPTSVLASTALLSLAMFAANASAQAPAGSTGECKDGTYSASTSKRGACAAHGGIKDWYGTNGAKTKAAAPATTAAPAATAATAAAAPAAATASTAASTSSSAKPKSTTTTSTKSEMPATAVPGGGPGKVWVNTSSKVYHCQGDEWYGKTKKGEYMTEAAAKAAGNHADHGKACS
jgi:Protein of unknown function (DUF3761)